MKIEGFKVDKNNQRITWYLNHSLQSIMCKDLDNACLFEKYKIIVALIGTEQFPSMLKGFSLDGSTKFEVKAPEGYVFSHLVCSEHPTAGIAVVCGGERKVDGWYDWHFSVNPSTGELTRNCPAY